MDAARGPRLALALLVLFGTCFLSAQSTDQLYDSGLALAEQQKWEEARAAFLAGAHENPTDPRFPRELGGIAFQQKDHAQAAHWLRRALSNDPQDSYVADFLGTVYFVEGNLEAALNYWNRIDRPLLTGITLPEGLRTDPILLDRTLRFAPGEIFKRSELDATRARLDSLGIFPNYRIRLAAVAQDRFNATLDGVERNGFGDGRWSALASMFRSIGFQAVRPEYYNIAGRAINVETLARWDRNKRRLTGVLSGPLHRDLHYRYQLGFDARDENWDTSRSALSEFKLRTSAVSARVAAIGDGVWSWSLGGELSHRAVSGAINTPPILARTGTQLKQTAELTRRLWSIPERRFTASAHLTSDVAKLWSVQTSVYGRLQAAFDSRWFPRMSGDDYAQHLQVRAGKVFGQAPFDQLFILGMERDNDLWLRGHVGTSSGRKGSAPLGHGYIAMNWDLDKRVFSNGFLSVYLSPFFDTGSIASTVGLGSRNWLFDTGLQAKLRLLGVGLTFIYGKDLRTGNNVFYTADAR